LAEIYAENIFNFCRLKCTYLKELKVIVKPNCIGYFEYLTYVLILEEFEKRDGPFTAYYTMKLMVR